MTWQKNQKAVCFLVLAVCLISMSLSSVFLGSWYRKSFYQKLSGICQELTEAMPQQEQIIFEALKEHQLKESRIEEDGAFLLQHGYRESDFSGGWQHIWILTAVLFLSGSFFFLLVLFLLDWQKQKRIKELLSYLEAVNIHGTGTILAAKEDDFSLLQDEIYKTVTMLHQTREEAFLAKENYADNLANIAHQIKTPIAAASISLQMLQETGEISYARQAKGQLKRLSVLEEALLMLSKIDSGTLQLVCEPVDVYTVLTLAADQLYHLSSERNVTVDIMEGEAVFMMGDLDWSMEAFFNLMKNCLEHAKEGSSIHCTYKQNPLYTEILIWDEGDGFEEEDLPHLFERFYRGKKEKGDGIGIGLSLAKSILEMQNGTISAKNFYRMPKGGAGFEIRMYGKYKADSPV